MASKSKKNTETTGENNGAEGENLAEVFAGLSVELDKGIKLNKRTEDVTGYWLPEHSPIFCIPRQARAFDSNLDPTKPSILIMVELLKECALRDAETEKARIGKAGELVGIWYKPGMKDVGQCAGLKTLITLDGTKDVGRPSPMTVFRVETVEKTSAPLMITSDFRKHSAAAKLPFAATVKPEGHSAPDAGDNLPF